MKRKVYTKDILLVLISSFFFMTGPMLVTPLIAGFSAELGASGFFMGIIGGLMNICSLACRPIAGNLADLMSKYKISFIGSILMTVACLGYVFAQSTLVLAAARVIHGIGFSCCTVCMSSWMADMLPKEKIGSGMGLYGTMNALAMGVAPAAGIWVYSHLGHRNAFVVAALFSVIMMVMIQFVKDKGLPAAAMQQGEKTAVKIKHQKVKLLDWSVFPIALVIMLFGIPYCATQSFLVTYVSARDLAVAVSLFFPIYALAVLVVRLGARKQFDKVPYTVFLVISSLSSICSLTCLAVMDSDLWMITGAIFMAGGYGIMCSVSQSNAILQAKDGQMGLANGTYYVGLDLGMALGPIIGGWLYGNVSMEYFYPLLMVTVPLMYAVHWGSALFRKWRNNVAQVTE